jgi:hypothetical protein
MTDINRLLGLEMARPLTIRLFWRSSFFCLGLRQRKASQPSCQLLKWAERLKSRLESKTMRMMMRMKKMRMFSLGLDIERPNLLAPSPKAPLEQLGAALWSSRVPVVLPEEEVLAVGVAYPKMMVPMTPMQLGLKKSLNK